MKRATRNVLIIVPVLLLVAIGGVYLVRNTLVRSAIEEGGSQALGVDTSLSGVDLDLMGQEFSLDGYEVANPEGFGDENFLSLQRGHLEVDGGTILSETIRVPRLELQGIDLSLVQIDRDGNYRSILESVRRAQKPASDGDSGASEEGKKLWIDEIVISDVKVSVRLELADREPTVGSVEIDELVLHDVGGEEGVGVKQLTALITQGLIESTLQASGGELPSLLEAGIRQRLNELPALSSLGVDLDTMGATVSLRDFDADGLLDEAKNRVLDVLTGDDGEGK